MRCGNSARDQSGFNASSFVLALSAFCVCASAPGKAAAEEKARPAGPRTTKVVEYLSYPALFAGGAGTLDPTDVARISWRGWLSKRGLPWGTLPDGKPTIRLSFDCRALPWPSIKQHDADGPDNGMRALGALALLHDMFGDEFQDNTVEAGIIGYLAFCTDPGSGIQYCPDTSERSCGLGDGELVKNLILMYKYTGDVEYRDWAAKAASTLRKYAVLSELPEVGPVAGYHRYGFNPSLPFDVGPGPMNDNFATWSNLGLGWNAWAFAEWNEVTGDADALDFAVALANRVCTSANSSGNDGSFKPDGSFGGNSQEFSASWHMHAHTHCLPGLLLLGERLIRTGDRQKGLTFIRQAGHTFDWLYDPTRNPDAGSMTGWLGEWLMVATGWERQADCEGCTVGDMVQTATALGAASRLDEGLSDYARYYDRAEQIFRGQCIEQMFTLREDYCNTLKDCLRRQIAKEAGENEQSVAGQVGAVDGPKTSVDDQELDRRLKAAMSTAERMVGQQLGACGFPDWVNKLPSDLNPELPGTHMQGCCGDATVRAAHAIWRETVTGDADETRVNLAFNRHSNLVDIISCLPHRGELDIFVKDACKVLVRVPQWASRQDVRAYVDKREIPVEWHDSYVIFADVSTGQQLTVTYPLRVAEITETPGGLDGTTYTEIWRGNTIVDVRPAGKWIPMFVRPELNTEQVP